MFNYILSNDGVEKSGYQEQVRDLQPQELCVFHISHLNQIEIHSEFIRDRIRQSKKVVFRLNPRELSRPGAWSKLRSFEGLYAVSICYRLSQVVDSVFKGAPERGQEGDLQVVTHFDDLVERSKVENWQLKIIPEVEINDHIQLLGPTLMALSKSNPPWMILTVDSAPTPSRVSDLKNCFEYLQIRGFPQIDVHFSYESKWARTWKVQSENFFSGPEEFHIDLSNKCTHSCVFCALYAPVIIDELKSTNKMDESMRRYMSAQIDGEKVVELIRGLPITTRLIQFGGAGDPMLHPRAMELIKLAREQGFPVEILSNMEYFKDGDHELLTSLGSVPDFSLKFIANVSAASSETYVLTRPRQTPATFNRVVENIRRFAELRVKNGGHGVHVVMMCVVNRLNFRDAPMFVELAKEIGAQVWFKALELHSRFHHALLPTNDEMPEFRRTMREAVDRADKLGVNVFYRDFLEDTINA